MTASSSHHLSEVQFPFLTTKMFGKQTRMLSFKRTTRHETRVFKKNKVLTYGQLCCKRKFRHTFKHLEETTDPINLCRFTYFVFHLAVLLCDSGGRKKKVRNISALSHLNNLSAGKEEGGGGLSAWSTGHPELHRREETRTHVGTPSEAGPLLVCSSSPDRSPPL